MENEPNSHSVDEDCTCIYFRKSGNKWNDAPCEFKAKSICKKPKEGSIVAAQTESCSFEDEATRAKTLLTGKEPAYIISDGDATWPQAKTFCENWGGRLATIHSEIEQKNIEKLLKNDRNYWIGLTDAEEEDTWVWVDDRPESFSNWAGFEPNNWADDGENCGEIRKKGRRGRGESFKWNDNECSAKRQFICQNAAATDSVTTPLSTILLSFLLPLFLCVVPVTLLSIYFACFRKGGTAETDALKEAELRRIEAEEAARIKSEKMLAIKVKAEETARRLQNPHGLSEEKQKEV